MLILKSYFLIQMSVIVTDSTFVATNSGPIRGQRVVENEWDYDAYYGIPYAEPPVGKLRFLPPIPKQQWTDILNATTEGPVCPQPEGKYSKDQMNEDCLYLNVYVPRNRTQPLPVLAYVHGGEFKSMSGKPDVIYGPQLYLQQNMIFVTMNYRLGALGFLSFGVEQASGNAGIKDVLLALQWINTNIENFGGDKNKITLAGSSAGAVLSHYVMLTEKSTGLFQQALLISGSALSYRFLARHPIDNALALTKELGLETEDTNFLIKKLRGVDAFQMVQAQEKMGNNDPRNGFRPFAPFVPCVEIEHANAVITKDPLEIVKAGIPQNVRVLAGFNSEEGIKMLATIKKNPKLAEYLNENFERCIPSDIEYPLGSDESKNLSKSIKQFYFGGREICNKTLQNFVNLVTDTQFSYGIDTWIKLHQQRTDSKAVYYYFFNFDGDLNWFKLTNDVDFPGTSHADELGYMFVTKATKTIRGEADERSMKMSNTIVHLFSAFVKYGNPTPDDCDKIKWPRSREGRNYLLLNENPLPMFAQPYPERLRFWNNVYEEYFSYVENGGPIEAKIVP